MSGSDSSSWRSTSSEKMSLSHSGGKRFTKKKPKTRNIPPASKTPTLYGPSHTPPASKTPTLHGPSHIPSYISFQKKFRYHDGHGRQLTAGGLLPYDDTGVWIVCEKKKGKDVEWTDPGGKYKFEDCDIHTTISREFCEEMYHSSSLTRSDILKISETHVPTYVNGHRNYPVYICYTVHTDELKNYGVEMNPELFLQYREKALRSNPDVPVEFYSSIELRHVTYQELETCMHKTSGPMVLGYRLKRILRYSPLHTLIYDDRSITPDISENIPSDLEETEVSVPSIIRPIPQRAGSDS